MSSADPSGAPDSSPPSANIPALSSSRGIPVTDPQIVQKLVEELKSQGTFDQFRKECLAEVDTKPAFQNLRQKVEGTLTRFLSKENDRWSPTMNKTQLRNKLRNYIQETSYMEAGVERIVDQVVNPKVFSSIEPEVEGVIYNVLGLEKPNPEEMKNENGHNQIKEEAETDIEEKPNVAKSEKLSTVSSEDIEMRSADENEADEKPKLGSSPVIQGSISPLTPEKSSPRSQISPLTPPPHPKSDSTPMQVDEEEEEEPMPPGTSPRAPTPRTPPYPPPVTIQAQDVVLEQEFAVQEEVIDKGDNGESMSPVSDTELADISPPNESPKSPSETEFPSPPGLPPMPRPPSSERKAVKTPPLPPPPGPPPPPPMMRPRPPSPITSPIDSSASDLESLPSRKSVGRMSASSGRMSATLPVSGPSDISDGDLLGSGNSESESGKDTDIEELEKARAALQAKLAAASLEEEDEEESEGEVRSGESESENKSTKSPAGGLKNTSASLSVSPVSDSMSPLATSNKDTKSTSEDSDEEKVKENKTETNSSNLKKDDKNSDDDDNQAGGSQGGSSQPKPSPPPSSEQEKRDDSSKDEGRSNKKEDGKKERRASKDSGSKDRSKHHRGHHHHHRSKEKSRRHSSSSGSKHERRSETSSGDKKESSSHSKDESKKLTGVGGEKDKGKKRVVEKEREKLQKIEMKIREKSHLKSEKFKDFDMFAPKPPKPKVQVQPRPNSSASSGGSASPMIRSPSAWGLKTPPTFGSKTPPASFGHKTPPASSGHASKTPTSPETKRPEATGELATVKVAKSNGNIKVKERRVSQELTSKLKVDDSFIVDVVERKKFPELPVPKVEGDKIKQHEDDFIKTKRRLEEARNKKLVELKKKELEKKMLKAISKPVKPKTVSTQKSTTPKTVAEKPLKEKNELKRETPKKKLTLSDLSDEDEISDWSDMESPNLKNKSSKRKRKRTIIDSDEEEETIEDTKKIQTRTISMKVKADEILNSDPSVDNFEGFQQSDIDQALESKKLLDHYLDQDDDNISVTSIENDNTLVNDFIYLDELENPEPIVDILAKFGGNPKLVPPMPEWLEQRLASWDLQRHDVNVHYPESGFKPKRYILEKTFTDRLNKRKNLNASWTLEPAAKKSKKEYPPQINKMEQVKSDVAFEEKVELAQDLEKQVESIGDREDQIKNKQPTEKEIASEGDISERIEVNPEIIEESVNDLHADQFVPEDKVMIEEKNASQEEEREEEKPVPKDDFYGFHPADVADAEMSLMSTGRLDLSDKKFLNPNGFTFGMEEVLFSLEDLSDSEDEGEPIKWEQNIYVGFGPRLLEEMQILGIQIPSQMIPKDTTDSSGVSVQPSSEVNETEGSASPGSLGSLKENVEDQDAVKCNEEVSRKSRRISNKHANPITERCQTRGRRSGNGALQSKVV